MLDKTTGFARYSKPLCWIVSIICLLIAVLSFTGSAENATVLGLLWTAGAVAFAIPAIAMNRGGESTATGGE